MAETAIIGAAIGAAVVGMRPVCEMQFADFVACGFDQLVNVAGKMHYRQGLAVPITLRLPSGGGFSGGPFHSQNPESWLMHAPGLKVLAPVDAGRRQGPPDRGHPRREPGLLHGAQEPLPADQGRGAGGQLRDADDRADRPAGRPAGRHRLRGDGVERPGGDRGSRRGVEVLDLRSLVPLDEAAILDSVRRCGKVVVVDEANRTCAAGAEVAALVAERAFE